jgi:integrase
MDWVVNMSLVERQNKDGSKTFWAVVYQNGKQVWVNAGRQRRAAQELHDRLATAGRDNLLPTMRDIKFSVLCERYLANGTHHLREQSITTYRSRLDSHLLPFFSDMKVRRSCSTEAIQRWIAWERHNGTSDKSIKRCLVALSAVLSYAVAINLITANPCSRVKAPKVEDGGVDYTLTPEQIQALIDMTPKSERGLMTFLCHTGSRPSEACEVRWRDINWRDALVIISRTAIGSSGGSNATKNSRTRTVPLTPSLLAALREQHKCVSNHQNDLVFPTTYGRRHQMQRWAKDVLRPSVIRAGLAVPEGSDKNYITRKSFITGMLSRGESVALVSEIVGASPATLLKHYAKHRTEDAAAAMQRMDAMFTTASSDTDGDIAQTA